MVRDALTRQQADLCWLERVHPMTSGCRNDWNGWPSFGNSCSSFSALRADAMIRDILQEFIREAIAADRCPNGCPYPALDPHRIIQTTVRAREWILANYPTAIPLEAMAETAQMNSQHFLRMFRDCYGITPHQFVTDVRLTVAGKLLTETKQPVSAICRQTGFESLSSLAVCSASRFGVSPSAYRKK